MDFAEQPGRRAGSSLRNNSGHAHTHTCARASILSILLFLVACLARAVSTNYSAPGRAQEMCGRHGDGSATRPANTIDHNPSALACAARTLACFPLFPGSVRKRAKAQFMK